MDLGLGYLTMNDYRICLEARLLVNLKKTTRTEIQASKLYIYTLYNKEY